MPRCIPSGTTWLLSAPRAWCLLTNDTWNGKARKKLRNSLFPWMLWEENQMGCLTYHHPMVLGPSRDALNYL